MAAPVNSRTLHENSGGSSKSKPIDTDKDVAGGLQALLKIDPWLRPIAEVTGPLPLRRREGGFEGLAHIITSQQISGAAAESIWGRVRAAVVPFTPEEFLRVPEDLLRAAGLSGGK